MILTTELSKILFHCTGQVLKWISVVLHCKRDYGLKFTSHSALSRLANTTSGEKFKPRDRQRILYVLASRHLQSPWAEPASSPMPAPDPGFCVAGFRVDPWGETPGSNGKRGIKRRTRPFRILQTWRLRHQEHSWCCSLYSGSVTHGSWLKEAALQVATRKKKKKLTPGDLNGEISLQRWVLHKKAVAEEYVILAISGVFGHHF